jgi:hypothetical protein
MLRAGAVELKNTHQEDRVRLSASRAATTLADQVIE